jgi:hypothetical protein
VNLSTRNREQFLFFQHFYETNITQSKESSENHSISLDSIWMYFWQDPKKQAFFTTDAFNE